MKIEVLMGDITKIQVDAIVNAANSSLLGGSGVDGAIHRVGGQDLRNECQKIRNRQGSCKVGEAVITTGGKLPSNFVIHAVGPVWRNGKNNEENLLHSAYENSLQLAVSNKIKTIAFPNISTGVYNFPKEKAARIAIEAVTRFSSSSYEIEKVIFVCYDTENFNIYTTLLGV